MDHGGRAWKIPEKSFPANGRRRCEASYFPESGSVSDTGDGEGPQLSALASSDKRAKRRCDGERRSPDFL
jgi:hypothetical protein